VAYGLVLTLFAVAILATAPRVLDRAERAGFSPRALQRAWRSAACGAAASLLLALPVLTPDVWGAPPRAAGFDPRLVPAPVPAAVQVTVTVLALGGLVLAWRRGRPALADYRRALHVQLSRLEGTAPLLRDEQRGHPRLVIVEDTRPRLVLLPSDPPRVEATTRALDLLRPEELEAVLTHMSGHLRRRDAAWIVAADVLAETYPWIPFLPAWADRSAALAEKAADADVHGDLARRDLRRALAKLSGPGQAAGPFCPCFAWPQQRQADLEAPAGSPAAPARSRGPVADVGLRLLTAAALVVPTAVVVSPHLLYV
jgi:hypothetical protein